MLSRKGNYGTGIPEQMVRILKKGTRTIHQRDNSSIFTKQKNYPISARGKLKNELNWVAN